MRRTPKSSTNAIDLGSIQWDELGGKWSPKARNFVDSFGLTRPFTPEAEAYCIDEHWHFELGAEAPETSEGAPKEGEAP